MVKGKTREFVVGETHPLVSLGRALKENLSCPWSEVRRLLLHRHVAVNAVLCRDEARRVTPGERVTVHERPLPAPLDENHIRIVHCDEDLIVVEKPSGMVTVRPNSELQWSRWRRDLQPTLDEVLARRFPDAKPGRGKETLYPVHRIDRDTSGLLLFARHNRACEHIMRQFALRQVYRGYRALVPGEVPAQTIRTRIVRDRGDGLRGSTATGDGEEAITQVTPLRTWGHVSELACRLETGRTNQIRIHLAELGHPVCGDIKYRGPYQRPLEDNSGVPRLALHASELRLVHPRHHETLVIRSDWPPDMAKYLEQLPCGKSS